MSSRSKFFTGAASMWVGMLASTAHAQEAGSSSLEEIVVTAQRRSERLQDVPLAVSAVTAETLEAAGVTDASSLTRIAPGLVVVNARTALTPYLRGVGTQNSSPGDEGSIALYVDGVYYASALNNLMSLANIERVEVLRGPQGTLFGRNATGGLIHVITSDPSQSPELRVQAGYASFETTTFNGYANVPLADTLALNVAGSVYSQQEGWGRNLITGEDVNLREDYNVRSKLRWDAGADTSVTLTGDYSYVESDSGNTRTAAPESVTPGNTLMDGVGLLPGMTAYDTRGDARRDVQSRQFGASLRINHSFSDKSEISSITAYRDYDYFALFDQDGTALTNPFVPAGVNASRAPATLLLNGLEKTLQQEFLLNNSIGPVDLTSGVFLFRSDSRFDPLEVRSGLFPGGSRQGFNKQITDSAAVYSQGTYHVTDTTNLTLGVRYTEDEREISGVNVFGTGLVTPSTGTLTEDQRKRRYNKLTYRVALDQKIGDDVLVYASQSRGFKSGVFNTTSPTTPAVEPEVLDATAVGFKSDLFDTLRFNAEAFRYRYSNVQLNIISPGGSQLINAAKGDIEGLDVELVYAPVIATGRLEGSLSASFLDATYASFPNAPLFYPATSPVQPAAAIPGSCSTNTVANRRCTTDAAGNDMIASPKRSGTASVDYKVPVGASGDVGVNVSYYYSSSFFWSADNRIRQEAFGLLNAQLSFTAPNEKWGVKLWGSNLTDKVYYTSMSHNEYGDLAGPGAPRTYGVTLSYNWGE